MIVINENDRIYEIKLTFTISVPADVSKSQILRELNSNYTKDRCRFDIKAVEKQSEKIIYDGSMQGRVKTKNIKKTIERHIDHGLNLKIWIAQEEDNWLLRPQRLIVDGAVEFDFVKNSKPSLGRASMSKQLRR